MITIRGETLSSRLRDHDLIGRFFRRRLIHGFLKLEKSPLIFANVRELRLNSRGLAEISG